MTAQRMFDATRGVECRCHDGVTPLLGALPSPLPVCVVCVVSMCTAYVCGVALFSLSAVRSI